MNNNLNLNSKKFDFIFKSPEIILPITFFILCLLGSLLLAIPLSLNGRVNFLDSVFTAVSAVCVTGLSVFDVGSTLTSFGQLILIVLIQLGGLGIMSISSIVFLLLGKRMSLSYAKTARNIFDVESNLEIKKSLILIFKFTFWTELIGAIILPDGAKKYYDSHYKIENSDLYISNGLGVSNYNFRLFNTPSYNIYRLVEK